MSTVTYTATDPATGEAHTRTSGTMAYTHAVIGCGVTWHLSHANAVKASTSGQHARRAGRGVVVKAVPTAVNGKAQVGEYAGYPNAAEIDALIEAKNAPKQAPKAAAPAPVAEPIMPAAPVTEVEMAPGEGFSALVSAPKKVTFFVTRDSQGARTDEDAAMAHATIYEGESLAQAREALHTYMVKEAEWLAKPAYLSPVGLRRAADILEAADQAMTLEPEEGKNWSRATITTQTGSTVRLVWSITRSER